MRYWVAGGFAAALVGAGLVLAALPPLQPVEAPTALVPPRSKPPLRVVQTHSELTLQVDLRVFVDDADRRVVLASAVHLADAAFYAEVQEVLNAFDVVLYEGVEPKPDERLSERGKRIRTKERLWYADRAAKRYEAAHNGPVASLLALAAWDEDVSTIDAWGNPLPWPSTEDFSDIPGMSDLAIAMGLAYQQEVFETDRPGWKNSDVTELELERLLIEAGAKPDLLKDLMDEDLPSGLAELLDGLRQGGDRMRVVTSILVVETLLRADEMVEADGLGPWQEIIIEHRNRRVLADFDALDPGTGTVAIWYGALHFPGLEAGLRQRGFALQSHQWMSAIRIDSAAVGLSSMEVDSIRQRTARAIARRVAKAREDLDAARGSP